MNKLLQKVAKIFLGISMAAGVGVAIAGNRDVTTVNATVGSDVTIGNGTYTSAYETGFENGTTSTEYNKTKTYNTTEGDGASWSVYYGTVSTNAVISNSKSMQMRWYSSAKTNYPHAETTSSIANVKAFKFNYAVGNANLDFKVQYGTNGSSWTDIETVNTTGTGKTEYKHEFSSAISTFYFRVLVCLGTAPSSGNYTFRIDDVVFGSPKAVACTITLNKNGGSGGTDSVSATKGSAMPTLASAPTRTGYTFAGYYDDASAGTQYYTANRASARNWNKDGTTATLYAHWTANQYNINYYDQGGSAFSGSHESGYPTKHTYGTETTLKSATKGGHNFDGWFTTSACTGSAITSLGATAYTAAIDLYAKWTVTGTTYSISTTVTNGSYSGDTSITDNGGVASVTISPTGDFKLPASVSVSGADHTYNDSTGVISLSNATGNVTISAAMVALTEYSITVNETNGSHTGASTIKESRTASLTFTPASGYGQPSSVTVSGATSSWTRDTGVLSLSNPTGNVTVTYSAAANELSSITISANAGSYTLGDDFVMPTVTAKYTISADADVTSSASYSGYDPYTTGSQSVTISYTEGGITKTASYTATVSALPEKVTTITWTKVTSTSSLAVGDTVVIAASSSNYAISTTQNTNNRGVASITKSGDNISWTGSSVQELTLVSTSGVTDAPSGSFGLSPSSGNYLYAASSSKNYLRTKNTLDLDGCFVISFSNGIATIDASSSENNSLMQYNNSSTLFSCYGSSQSNGSLLLYKKYTTTTGDDPSLIRITAAYAGGDKNVGDSIYASDFTVKKQLNDSNNLIDVASGWTINMATLSLTSNDVTVSYTEGGITKTAVVTVAATERQATLDSVTLVVGEDAVLDGYIAWSGATWDLSDISVVYDWSDDQYDDEVDLQDLIDSGDASISPLTPTLGTSSFTITYSYLDVDLDDNVVTLDHAVRSDYVSSMSWSNTSASDFKHFSGETLTETIVNKWHVKATWAGAGEGERLYWGDYDLYVGSKKIDSLPYIWTTADDGQDLEIHYAEDVNGDEFIKTNNTAKGNICAVINAIDHTETGTGLVEKTAKWQASQSSSYDSGSAVDVALDDNIQMTGGIGTHDSIAPRHWSDGVRVYAGNEMTFTPKNGAIIKSITLSAGGECAKSSSEGSPWTISSGGDSAVVITSLSKTTPISADIVVVYDIEGTVTETVEYANDMNHFVAQKAVVKFAKAFNTAVANSGSSICSIAPTDGTNIAWEACKTAYATFLTDANSDLVWAKNMLSYATRQYSDDSELACVEKMMRTYEILVGRGYDAFMSEFITVNAPRVSPVINIIGENTNTVAIIVIISMVSVTAIGGYFFLRRRNEN